MVMKMPHIRLLKIDQVDDFIDWCREKGIGIIEGNGEYEVVQVHLAPHWHAIYKRDKDCGYLSVPDTLIGLVKCFLQDQKRDQALCSRAQG